MNLKRLREARGLKQIELAKRMSVDQSAISQWETGESTPSHKNLLKLIDVLGCTVGELLSADNEAKSA